MRYAPGQHPNSLANLEPRGRKPAYEEPKQRRYLTVTEVGWQGIQAIAETVGCKSVSELIEKLGRGELNVSN